MDQHNPNRQPQIIHSYCLTCGGTGTTDPEGRSKQPCPACVAQDRCPRCAGNLTHIIGNLVQCPDCGWNSAEPNRRHD